MQIGLERTTKNKPGNALFHNVFEQMKGFVNKFNNDWMMQSAAGLAYNLLTASVPIVIAIVAAFGFTIGRLDPTALHQLVQHIRDILPVNVSTTDLVQVALVSLSRYAGWLVIIALLTAIFGGSRLFISIEGYFDITYRTYPRQLIPQNIMAILLMLVFIILTPLMVFMSSLPALIFSLVQNSVLNQLPGVARLASNGFVVGAIGILGSIVIGWIFFETIYLVIPNRKISFTKSWVGALLASILLVVYLTLFPLYITHFMGSYTGAAGFAVILLVFYYYFAVILLLGAEVNSYFFEHTQPLPNNLAVIIHDAVQNQVITENKPVETDEEKSNTTRVQDLAPEPQDARKTL